MVARWFRRSILLVGLALALGTELCAAERPNRAEDPAALAELSLEELGNIEITSVSKAPEWLSSAAASVFVITDEDIRRSGVTSIPEALRLAPNLQVARVDSSQYAISARGFNGITANKLLVLIDGRSVYTPLFSGVFWDAQDTLLEDIERIEVISGPGGTLWGANAVNGVINIITRKAKDTQGTLLSVGGGDEDQILGAFRYGGKVSDNLSYRLYGKYFERDDTVLANEDDVSDGWDKGQGGFRVDWNRGADSLTFQGDAYRGTIDQETPGDQKIEGENLLGRWERDLAGDANLQLQLYFDHTERDFPDIITEVRNTYDIEFQHRFSLTERHEIIWGAGYRTSSDHTRNSDFLAFQPRHRRLDVPSFFVQDKIALWKDRLHLTLGSKYEHNDYTGSEVQPSARLSWQVHERHFLWAAVSRAVRTPARLDQDAFIPASPPFLLEGGPDFESETVVAYELGYRTQPHRRVSLALTLFFNEYDHLRTLGQGSTPFSFVIDNGGQGETYGVELWGEVQLMDFWRLKAGYAFLEDDLRVSSGSTDPNEFNDAKHRFLIRTSLDVTPTIELDGTLIYVSHLPDPDVPAYTTLDLRLGWQPIQGLEFSLIGRNLLDGQHPEFGSTPNRREIERSVLVRAVWRL
jgi:iron complex outermembrane receptor protein